MGSSVAFILAGQLRGFLSVEVQHSIANTIGSSDLFVHLTLSESQTASRGAITMAAHRLGAARVKLVADINSSETVSSCPSLVRSWPGAMFHRFRSAWLHLWECFEMALEHEATVRAGRSYVYFVKLRSDEQICSALPPMRNWASGTTVHTWQPLPRCEQAGARRRSCHATDDHLAIVPRAIAETFFSAYLEAGGACDAAAYAPFCAWSAGTMKYSQDVPAECLLGRWLSRANVSVDRGGLLGVRNACMWNNATLVREGCVCLHGNVSRA